MSDRPVFPHPLIDARGDGFVVSRTAAARVAMGSARADFLVSAQRRQRRPILVTGSDAVLTEPLVRLLRETGGAWGVDGPDGAWDGFTGRRLTMPEAARRQAVLGPEDLHRSFLHPDAAPHAMRVRVFTSRRHRDAFETVLGGDIESLTTELTGAPPAGWGVHEPSGMPWDRDQLTLHARGLGDAGRYVVVGHADAHPLNGQITVHRTHKGVEELSEFLLTVGDERDAATTRRLSRLPALIEELATGVPLFAMALADPGRADLFRAPRLPRPTWPLAILIGAPGMRALGVDADDFAARHHGRVLGRRRVPSLLLDLTDADSVTAWGRLRAVADEIGEERMTDASPVLSGLLFGGGSR